MVLNHGADGLIILRQSAKFSRYRLGATEAVKLVDGVIALVKPSPIAGS